MDNPNKKTFTNNCKGCLKYEDHYKLLYQTCDSVFDMAMEMQIFVLECTKKCHKNLDNRLK